MFRCGADFLSLGMMAVSNEDLKNSSIIALKEISVIPEPCRGVL
jgi:hypothetical protein